MRYFTSIVALLLCSSCAMAPLTSTKNARPLGAGNWEINTGFSPSYTFSAGRGMGDAFDLGATLELGLESTTALWGKYSLLGADGPAALALYGGGFDSSGGRGFFLGPVVDYRKGWFEAYFIPKYNYVDWKAWDIENEEDDAIVRIAEGFEGHHDYMQLILGFNFWFTDGFGLNLNGQSFRSLSGSSSLEFKDDTLVGAELMFRF